MTTLAAHAMASSRALKLCIPGYTEILEHSAVNQAVMRSPFTCDRNAVAGARAIKLAMILQLQVPVKHKELRCAPCAVRLRHILRRVVKVRELVTCRQPKPIAGQVLELAGATQRSCTQHKGTISHSSLPVQLTKRRGVLV